MHHNAHLYIKPLGLGYYVVCTRADVYGHSTPIHEPTYPKWGTLYHECLRIMSVAPQPTADQLREGRAARAAKVAKQAQACVDQGLDWNAGYIARQAARWGFAALTPSVEPVNANAGY